MAKIVGIGSGTVSEIVKDYNRRNPGFDLLREFVVAKKRRKQCPAVRDSDKNATAT
jgi:hypothetical protein